MWRFKPSDPWEDFALDYVHFGDVCLATQLEVAKNIMADAGAHLDIEAVKQIEEDVYVDDGLTGGTVDPVKHFVGEKDISGKFTGTFSKILSYLKCHLLWSNEYYNQFIIKDCVMQKF